MEILEAMGIGEDDRTQTFDIWLERKTDQLPAPFRNDVRDWAISVHYGGPRTRPRPNSAVLYLRAILPVLHKWASRYHHLREVTHDDVILQCGQLRAGWVRSQAISAFRSLFGRAKRNKLIFKNPATGLKIRHLEPPIWQPLSDDALAQSVQAATTPQARLWVALAAVHAARPGQIRSIQLGHLDLGNRRVVIAGLERPLDDLTYQLLLEYLEHRRATWPNTANPHLFVSKESAMRHGPVSHSWVLNLRGLPGTIEGLRIDRLLEEAIASRGDPPHMAEVFGLSDGTAVRYATNALKLLESAAECDPAVRHRL